MSVRTDDSWLGFAAAAAAAVRAIGGPRFPKLLFDWVSAAVTIDSCAVFAFDSALTPRHVFTYGRLEPERGETLARDYTQQFSALDPRRKHLILADKSEAEQVLSFGGGEDYPPLYLDHFFAQNALVDKAALIHSLRGEHIYCNVYRMADTGRFSPADWTRLRAVLPLAAAIIAQHALHDATPEARDNQTEPNASQFVHDLFGRDVPPFDLLAARESEVCERILLGLSTDAIARDLGIAASTVVTHRRRAYEKLQVGSQRELFLLCLDRKARVIPPR
ncbi:MAG: helix-turn-helix transcriptional regulator [Hyphomonadaceae bacterium]|nr:helix-turn-helix transcriptional regulator [Hyphomonadaceae bacterium]